MQLWNRTSNKNLKELDLDSIPADHIMWPWLISYFLQNMTVSPSTYTDSSWLLIHTVPYVQANLLWMAITSSVAFLAVEYLPHQWQSGNAQNWKSGGARSNPGRTFRPSRSEFSVVFSKTRVNVG